ncbi:MAG: SAM-dependent methyltransferase, partial [Haliscomenobacter sp.]
MQLLQTAERVSQHDLSDNYVFQRSILAYLEAAKLVSGQVLEIGTGSGYGIGVIADQTERFVTL